MTRYNPAKDRGKLATWGDPVLEEERAWILEREEEEKQVGEGEKQEKGKAKAIDDDDEPEMEDGKGIECQCCFSEYPFVRFFSSRIPTLISVITS